MHITIFTNWATKLVALCDKQVILSKLREVIKAIKLRLFDARFI